MFLENPTTKGGTETCEKLSVVKKLNTGKKYSRGTEDCEAKGKRMGPGPREENE